MRSGRKRLIVCVAMLVIVCIMTATAYGTESNVTYVHKITDSFIEIGYVQNFAGSKLTNNDFKVTVNGAEAAFNLDAFFDDAATLRLSQPLKDPENDTVIVTTSGNQHTAGWVPFYTFTDKLNSMSAAERGNQGTKSKIWVYGNEESGCTDLDPQYTAEYVIRYCAEGINKMVGRSDFLTLSASRQDLRVVVVGSGNSVYTVPEYRHLYNEKDANTRVTIAGSRECPIVVTTAADVMRVKSDGDSTFNMLYDFARLFYQLGVKDGWPEFALSVYDSQDTYNYVKHLEEAYDNARKERLWPGTKMMDSIEEYFAYGTMVWYEGLEESADGSWQKEAFPVNSRREMLRYDEKLYGVLVEIYGEFEYFSGYMDQNSSTIGSDMLHNFPWYKSSQRNNYDITGKLYEPLYVSEANLISANEIELVFNREVKDIDELRNKDNWTITWKPEGSSEAIVFEKDKISCQNYQWQTVTLQVRGQKWYQGYIGSDVEGFTEQEVMDGYDQSSSGYKPWFKDSAYKRSVGPSKEKMAVGPEIYNKYHVEGDGLTLAEPFTVTPSESAIAKGQYVSLKDGTLNGKIDGSLTVTFSGGDVSDWSGNKLKSGDYTVEFKPWLGQVMRSDKTGVYVYGDNTVAEKSLKVACEYWDAILSNPKDDLGQRMADGMVWGGGGAQIMGYHNHAYMMPGSRSTHGQNNHHYLYVEGFGGGICQTTESNLLRDFTYTRYDNEFILGHEGAHSIEITAMPYFTDMNYFVEKTYTEQVTQKDLWNNGGYSYAGSNRAEYFATLTNIWHNTMRESTDGSNNGTWLSINTREELFRYDTAGYELMKSVYYNGHTYLSEERLRQSTDSFESEAIAGWDAEDNSINNGIIKWGCSFPYTMYEKDNDFKWISWGCANQWDVNDDHDPNSGIRYDEAMINYNPYLNEETKLIEYNLKVGVKGDADVKLMRNGAVATEAAENQKVTVDITGVPEKMLIAAVQVCTDSTTATAIQSAEVEEVRLQSGYEFLMPGQDAYVNVTFAKLAENQHKLRVDSASVIPSGVRIKATTAAAVAGEVVEISVEGFVNEGLIKGIEIKNIITGELITPTAINAKEVTAKEPVKYSFIMPDSPVAITMNIAAMEKTEAPTADVTPGAVERGTEVILKSATEGAAIYYTIDGTSPDTGSASYTGPVKVEFNMTLKAIAVADNMIDSGIETFKYTIVQAEKPVASPVGQEVEKGTLVELTTATEGAKIHYTTDGSQPGADSKLYDGKIKVSEDMTIRAVAVKENYADSEIMTEHYRVKSSDSGKDPGDKDDDNDHSSGSKPGSSTSGSTDTGSVKTPEFADLAGYEWAAEYIKALAGKGIILGTSDITFSPGANIKRADYIVLLVRMLGLTADTSDGFADVTADAYYYREVTAAKALGLIEGTGDNLFNPNAPVSRQDMFVIAERMLKMKGVEMTDDTSSLSKFSDEDSISDYARIPLANLVNLNLVKGNGQNVNPLGNATRAETAVFVYRLGELLGII